MMLQPCEEVAPVAGLGAKVNLIALNPGPGLNFGMPKQERVLAFQNVLVDAGIPRSCGNLVAETSLRRAVS